MKYLQGKKFSVVKHKNSLQISCFSGIIYENKRKGEVLIMKRRIKSLFACVLMVIMVLTLTACGGSSKYKTMDDYVKSSEIQEQLKSLKEQITSDSGMEINMFADGDALVYEYRYTEIEKQDGMAEALKSGLAEQESTFKETANALKSVVDIKNPVVDIRYIDSKGELIYSQQFIAD